MNTERPLDNLLNTPVPVLPIGLNRLMQSFDSDNMTHLKLAEIIADFPSIAARLLFLANSAWASPQRPVENLETACARLGFSMVRSVSISLCIVSPFNASKQCPAFDTGHFWCSALLTAEGAALLAATTDADAANISTLHTAGLLHNLGLLWLAGNWPEDTSKALQLATTHTDYSISEALRDIVGTDYCEAGGALGRAWQLPDVLVAAMAQNHPDLYPDSTHVGVKLVGYAAEMVSALQTGRDSRPALPEQTGLNFESDRLDQIYRQLGDKLIKTRELACTLFSAD